MQKSSLVARTANSIVEQLEERKLLAQTVAVDLNSPLQTIRAIGTNVAKNSRNPNPTAPARDAATNFQLDNLPIGMLRVAINLKTWEPVNDNSDPNVVRVQGFPDYGWNKQNFEMMREYTQKGVPIIAGIFDLPDWMVSNPQDQFKRELKPGFETELAEAVSHWLLYAKQQYGVNVDLISINEGNGGYNARFNQLIFTNFLLKAGPFMANKGLGNVKWLTGDDGVNTLNAHTKPLLENPAIRQYLGPVAYHSWSFRFINDANLEQWYVQANRYNKEVWATEFGTDAESSNLPTFATFQRAHDTALAYYRALTVTRATVILWWQFASDFALVDSQLRPNPSYYIVKPFHDNVGPGSQMLKVTPTTAGAIKTVATKDTARNKFFAQVYNGGSVGTNSESVTLTGLPNTALTITRNTDGDYNKVIGTFTPVNGKLTFSSPAFSVINITGKLSNSGAGTAPVATISAPTGATQYTSGGVLNFSGTGNDAEDGSLAASRFNWTITPVRNGIVGTPVTFNGVKSGSYTIPAAFQRITDQKFIVELKVTDSTNLINVKTVEITPKIVNLTVNTNVPGVVPGVNGLWESLTSAVPVVAGVQNLFAPSPQLIGGKIYKFSSWSNGGAATQNVNISSNSTFTANFTEVTDGSAGLFFGDAGDAYVRDGDGADINYGQDVELQTKISGDLGKTRYAYFRFNIGDIAIPAAKLRLFGKLSGNGELVATNVFGVDANWDESTITFNNRPQFSGNPIWSNTVVDQVGRWYEFDVSTHVQAARAAGATSVAFAVAQAANSSPYFGITSGEGASGQPQLFIGGTPSTPPTPTGASIRGTVFNDLDQDGVRDAGEGGVAGRTIYLDANNNSVFDPGEKNTLTAADGTYAFTNLAAGSYKIRQILPTNFTQTSPANNFGNNATVSGTQTATGEDFGSFETIITTGATIRGTVFLDTDRDGIRDAGENGVASRSVFLDINNNSTLDSGEATTSTNASGEYTFTGLLPGDYKIRQILPSGFIQTSPAGNAANDATVTENQIVTGEDFGTATSTPTPTGATIRGTVFLDADRDRIRDAGEAGVSGRTVYLDNNNNSVLDAGEPSALTDSTGAYSFTGLSAGDYKIRQVLPSGFIQTTPTNNFGNNATVSGTQTASGEDFGTAASTSTPTTPRDITTNADSYVRDSNVNTNYGSGVELSVQQGNSGVNRRTYLKFDISSITNFNSVILKLGGRLSAAVTDGLSVGVFAAGDNWTEGGLTWSNRPVESTLLGSVRVRDTTRRTYELDLTQYIRDQRTAGQNTITLVLNNLVSTVSTQSLFTAKESSLGGSRLTVS